MCSVDNANQLLNEATTSINGTWKHCVGIGPNESVKVIRQIIQESAQSRMVYHLCEQINSQKRQSVRVRV